MCCAARGTRSTERGGRGAGFWEPIGAGRSALCFVGGGVLRMSGSGLEFRLQAEGGTAAQHGGSEPAQNTAKTGGAQRGEETNAAERDRRQARPRWAGEFGARELGPGYFLSPFLCQIRFVYWLGARWLGWGIAQKPDWHTNGNQRFSVSPTYSPARIRLPKPCRAWRPSPGFYTPRPCQLTRLSPLPA